MIRRINTSCSNKSIGIAVIYFVTYDFISSYHVWPLNRPGSFDQGCQIIFPLMIKLLPLLIELDARDPMRTYYRGKEKKKINNVFLQELFQYINIYVSIIWWSTKHHLINIFSFFFFIYLSIYLLSIYLSLTLSKIPRKKPPRDCLWTGHLFFYLFIELGICFIYLRMSNYKMYT